MPLIIQDVLLNELQRFQELRGVSSTKCPISGCHFSSTMMAPGDNLFRHYGVQHGAAMDNLLNNREIAKMEAFVQVIEVRTLPTTYVYVVLGIIYCSYIQYFH